MYENLLFSPFLIASVGNSFRVAQIVFYSTTPSHGMVAICTFKTVCKFYLFLFFLFHFVPRPFQEQLRYMMKIKVHSMKKISPSPLPFLPVWAMTSGVAVKRFGGLLYFPQGYRGFLGRLFFFLMYINVCWFFSSFPPNPVFCLDLQLSDVMLRPRPRGVVNLFFLILQPAFMRILQALGFVFVCLFLLVFFLWF